MSEQDIVEEQTDSPAPAAAATAAATTGVVETAKKGSRCYVGNLEWSVESPELEEHMKQAGSVVSAEVMKSYDGRSKGCGIVEFATEEEARAAISQLNDTEVKGRMIFVREDREFGGGGPKGGRGGKGRGVKSFEPKSSGPVAEGGGGGGGGGSDDDEEAEDDAGNARGSCSVYVGNLAYETSWQNLKDHMRQAGNVDSATVLTDGKQRSKGCGIVVYQRSQDAKRAILELQNSELDGRPIFVREDREPGGRRGRSVPGGSSGTQLYVGNLSYDTSWKELKDHFRQCGDVQRAEVMEGNGGRKKGFGTVQFYKQEDANKAIEMLNGIELQGRELTVRLDHKAN